MATAPQPSAGRLKQISGKTWQQIIRASIELQAVKGDHGLDLDETSPGIVVTGSDGAGRRTGFAKAPGALDYVGAYVRPRKCPWPIEFDAKWTKHPSRFDLSLLHPRQVKRLHRKHASRFLAFFLAGFFDGQDLVAYAITWPVLEPYWVAYQRYQDGYGDKAPASIPRAVLEAQCYRVATYQRGGAWRLNLVDLVERMITDRLRAA